MELNLYLLEGYGKSAVYCETEDQAKLFMDAMWEQFPDKVTPAWSRGQTNWRTDRDGIYYVPRIFHSVDPGEYSHCQSSSLDWVVRNGYRVVPVTMLAKDFDLGEISAEEVDIKTLFEAW